MIMFKLFEILVDFVDVKAAVGFVGLVAGLSLMMNPLPRLTLLSQLTHFSPRILIKLKHLLHFFFKSIGKALKHFVKNIRGKYLEASVDGVKDGLFHG